MLARMQFTGVWRDYQARVLEQLSEQSENGRLHIVAAPGAGKTVLGLEIVRRLGRPALVFAPTVAIRDQWAHRLSPLFLEAPPAPEDISHDLAAPRVLTLATYQALDAPRRSEDVGDLARTLEQSGPVTLVLDEAHHLRREWWNSIEQLTASLNDVRIVALTATPPYDASFAEWTRYEGVCGPIDLEIGIPELVRNGDLCPHQDHVILSEPTEDALQLLDARRRGIAELQRDVCVDAELLDALEAHPWVARPEAHVEAILEAPEMLSSVLVLLAGAGRRLPHAPFKLLGVSARSLPHPSPAWLEIFLDGVLNSHAPTFAIGAERSKTLRDRLHRYGLIEGGRVRMRETRSTFQLMASSLAKLDSVARIAAVEDRSLRERLRMVVLSDHIRAGELPSGPEAEFKPSKPGVVPIFEHLRRAGVCDDRLGVLTGTLVILPARVAPALRALLAERRLPPSALRIADLAACPGYVRVDLTGGGQARLIQLVTTLFERGEVRVLVGTQSLLGEGWDAPTLNSLVLASNTASFMLSNQMRGRAIRVEPGNPDKVANIWHLATVEPPSRGLVGEVAEVLNWGRLMDEGPPGLSDIALLHRRFRAFEGISNNEGTTQIGSGLERLGLDLAGDFHARNERTFALAADRAGTARRWAASLGVGDPKARVRETAAPTYAPRVLAWLATLQALVWAAITGGLSAAYDAFNGLDSVDDLDGTLLFLAAVAAVFAAPKLFRAARLMWRNGSVEGSLEQVTRTVLEAMAQAGLIGPADLQNARIEVRNGPDARKEIVLKGVSRSVERQVFQALFEVLGTIENPRHLLVRHSWLGWRRRTDYHAVPSALGARKAWAETFAKLWRQKVGPSDLIATRTPLGRRILLRARAKSLAAGFLRSVDRRSAWL